MQRGYRQCLLSIIYGMNITTVVFTGIGPYNERHVAAHTRKRRREMFLFLNAWLIGSSEFILRAVFLTAQPLGSVQVYL